MQFRLLALLNTCEQSARTSTHRQRAEVVTHGRSDANDVVDDARSRHQMRQRVIVEQRITGGEKHLAGLIRSPCRPGSSLIWFPLVLVSPDTDNDGILSFG